MKIVLDTNVIVSGLLNPRGIPGQIVRWVTSGKLTLCFDVRILTEYREVLSRSKFAFHPELAAAILQKVESAGLRVAATPLGTRLPDESDEPFLEVALAGSAACLVTGNLRHYPEDRLQGMQVISPTEFLDIYRAMHSKP